MGGKRPFVNMGVQRPRLMNLKVENARKQRGDKDRRGNSHGISTPQRPKPELAFGSVV